MNPQVYDYIIDRLMHQGAQDAYLTPIIMKKSRPAIQLSVLTDASLVDRVVDTIFRETTSIGVRVRETARRKLSREIREVETVYGKVRIKVSKRGEEILTATPEYEDCRNIAEERKLPLKSVIEEAKASFSRKGAKDAKN
jgi:pyridinium-3,5-bisthiocarboxylic acid mononucleotide nickel chelatase